MRTGECADRLRVVLVTEPFLGTLLRTPCALDVDLGCRPAVSMAAERRTLPLLGTPKVRPLDGESLKL